MTRLLVVASALWLIVAYAVASESYRFSAATFTVLGGFPLLCGWGGYWIWDGWRAERRRNRGRTGPTQANVGVAKADMSVPKRKEGAWQRAFGFLVPEISDRDSAARAVRTGFWALVYVLGASVIYHSILGWPDAALTLMSLGAYCVAAFFVRRKSRVAAVIALGMYASDALYGLANGNRGGIVVTLMVTMLLLAAVRGAFWLAAHRPGPPAMNGDSSDVREKAA